MRVLVLRALGLGDLLTAVPALRGLRRAFPHAHLQLACPEALTSLALRTGAVDEVVPVGPLEPLPDRVAGAELAVNLHGRGPQSTALLAATRPGRLVAWGSTWRADEHEVQRWCRLLAEAGIPCDAADLHLSTPPRRSHVVVHPGAAKASRRWPVARWLEVVRGLADQEVVVTAGPGEPGLPGLPVVRPSLDGLVDLVGTARLVLCPDTGVAHLATATRTPSVVLFGPTDPALWGPPPGPHRVLWSGRTGDNEAPGIDPGLLEIRPADVLAAVREEVLV